MPKKEKKPTGGIDPEVQAAIEARREAERERALARVPEFAGLELSDDPEKVYAEIASIKSQAHQAIAETSMQITQQAVVLTGRCFLHLKKILPHGQFQESIETHGYKYDYVIKAMKVTETFADLAKNGTGTIFGGGKLLTMASFFRRDELRALASGQEVLGLDEAAIEKMSLREMREHVRAARAEAAQAARERDAEHEKRLKSNEKLSKLEEDLAAAKREAQLYKDGPADLREVAELCRSAQSHAIAAAFALEKARKLDNSESAHRLLQDAHDFVSFKAHQAHCDFDGVAEPEEMARLRIELVNQKRQETE